RSHAWARIPPRERSSGGPRCSRPPSGSSASRARPPTSSSPIRRRRPRSPTSLRAIEADSTRSSRSTWSVSAPRRVCGGSVGGRCCASRRATSEALRSMRWSRRSPTSPTRVYRWHAGWERQALIKARAVAGDLEVGRAFVEAVAPFVYPAELAPQAIDEVRRVKVRLEEYVRARGKEHVEVKRGRGGIRDVEFAVQLLQIVHGRRDESLRDPNTLRALEALAGGGYVAPQDADALADAYRFLRRVEHRLQLVRDTQT